MVTDYGGNFPSDPKELQKLPGIGSYTAGAIASIAFGVPAPAVDGNVLRVVSRLTEDDTPIDLPAQKKAVSAALAEVYPAEAILRLAINKSLGDLVTKTTVVKN